MNRNRTLVLALIVGLCLALTAGNVMAAKGGNGGGKPGGGGGEPSSAPRVALRYAGLSGSAWSSGYATARADGSKFEELTSGDNWSGPLAWSPDGRFLAVSFNTLRVLEVGVDQAWSEVAPRAHYSASWSCRVDSDGVTPLPAEEQFIVHGRETSLPDGSLEGLNLFARLPDSNATDVHLTNYATSHYYDESGDWDHLEELRASHAKWLPGRAGTPEVTWVVYKEAERVYPPVRAAQAPSLIIIEVTFVVDGNGDVVPETTAGPYTLAVPANVGELGAVAFSADGNRVAWTTTAGDIEVSELEYSSGYPQVDSTSTVSVNPAVLQDLEYSASYSESLSLDYTGSNVAFGTAKGSAYAMGVDASAATRISPKRKGSTGVAYGYVTAWER